MHVVCVNLYPFRETISKGPVPLQKAIEQIDIGGPTMVRAAAKNHAHVLVVVNPEDYSKVLENLDQKKDDPAFRFDLARKAFAHTASYDAMISEYLYSFEQFENAKSG